VAASTVRDAVFDVLRERSLTKMFANPGSTEVPFLVSLPDDLDFVLGLHEGSVVGMATGYALGSSAPALAILHTTAGLGNAVGALATARVNRAPLVVLVGQQDRRHLAHEPFLAGRLQGLAGEYPVWVDHPVRPQDLPGAVGRAWHEAATARGPALVIAPMDDWLAPADDRANEAAAGTVVRAAAADPAAIDALVALLRDAKSPALVAGSGSDDAESWAALVTLAERLGAPVWQESFGGQAGFPGDHPQFVGHLPADRSRLRETLEAHDVVLVIGAPAFRQYPYVAGTLAPPGTRVAVLTNDPVEAHRSVAELAVVAPLAGACAELARRLPAREAARALPDRTPVAAAAAHNPLSTEYVFDRLAERLAPNAVVIEESPSSRPAMLERLPAREPLGFLSPAMGGLGFAIPAATGIRMARPDRPVLAVVGDGSSLYSIQALWSAAHYRVGALFVILANGGYAIMDRLLEREGGGASPWPSFSGIDIPGLATAFGCPARRVTTPDELVATFDEVVPALVDREEPLLLEVEVAPAASFDP